MKLLIVDDSMTIRRGIQRMIDTALFTEVQDASNGRLALQKFREFQPDAVTMDITMPEMDGLTCIEMMLKERPEILILVVSALKDKATAVEAVKRGAQGFLLKPFTPEKLTTAISEMIADQP